MTARLQDYRKQEFHLVDLVNTAKTLIERSTIPPTDGRVAPVPDARTVRYYQTVGIMQKPLRYDGRSAVYGYHHLLQLIAIKLLQRQGLSLAQIQSALMQSTLMDLEENVKTAIQMQEKPPKREDQETFWISHPPLSMGKIEEKMSWREIEQRRSLEVPIYKRPEKRGGRNLIANEVAPGISVLIDPEKVRDPKGILAKIIKALKGQNGEKE